MQGFLDHLTKGEHLGFVLGLDGGDGRCNCKCHRAYYRLLDEGVHGLRVSGDFLETDDRFRELVYICEPRDVVKTRGSGSRCSYPSFGDVKKRGILCLNGSYVFDELLKRRVNVRSLLIACIALELVDGVGKSLDFC